jgi:rod shape-determining protein MreD
MSLRRFTLYLLFYAGVLLLDTAFLGGVSVFGVRPDLPLLVLVFLAHYLGAMAGKLVGFAGGLVEDMLGMAPLGFHALLGAVIGHLSGMLQGRVFLDALVLPALLAVAATMAKFLVLLGTSVLFLPERVETILSLELFIEIGIHAVLAPFVYGLLRLLRLVREFERHAL